MKFKLEIILIAAFFTACGLDSKKAETGQSTLPIIGTWQLISATSTEQDSTFSTFNPNNKMIKIITPTHFAFFNHDLTMGKDTATASYTAGGGTYTLSDSTYTEHLEYFNYREWEGHTFQFVVTIKNDTLTQEGIEKVEKLGIDRLIVEKYKWVK